MIRWMFVTIALVLAGMHGNALAASGHGRFVDLPQVASINIAPTHVRIWLPPGYGRGHRRYGVIYMQDGQWAFAGMQPGKPTLAAEQSVDRLVTAGTIDPVIIVAIWSDAKNRGREYYPQSLYSAVPAWARADADLFYRSPLYADAYLKFLTTELKPMIDAKYKTLRDPAHTSIVGASLGAVLSLYALAEYPGVFGAAACLSTHWPLANPVLTDDRRDALLAVWDQYLEARLGAAKGRRLWFDHGDKTLDQFYGPYQSHIDKTLVRIGWQQGRDVETRSYPGAGHEEADWGARLDDVFGWLLAPRAE